MYGYHPRFSPSFSPTLSHRPATSLQVLTRPSWLFPCLYAWYSVLAIGNASPSSFRCGVYHPHPDCCSFPRTGNTCIDTRLEQYIASLLHGPGDRAAPLKDLELAVSSMPTISPAQLKRVIKHAVGEQATIWLNEVISHDGGLTTCVLYRVFPTDCESDFLRLYWLWMYRIILSCQLCTNPTPNQDLS